MLAEVLPLRCWPVHFGERAYPFTLCSLIRRIVMSSPNLSVQLLLGLDGFISLSFKKSSDCSLLVLSS